MPMEEWPPRQSEKYMDLSATMGWSDSTLVEKAVSGRMSFICSVNRLVGFRVYFFSTASPSSFMKVAVTLAGEAWGFIRRMFSLKGLAVDPSGRNHFLLRAGAAMEP